MDGAVAGPGGSSAATGSVPSLVLPWVESPFFRRELAARTPHLSDEQRSLAEQFHTRGFVAVPGAVPAALCDQVRAEVEPMFEDEETAARRRVQDAWKTGAVAVRELATYPPILGILELLYERRPVPFQTLDFKWGTEQRGHSDSVHFSCLPARFMCGVWVALEEVDRSNGPLFYYPGSHRLPEITGYDLGFTAAEHFYPRYEDFQHELMGELGIAPVEFYAAKGDVLVWSSNLVHGGRPVHRPGSTRWSQVSHYFFDGCIYYQPHSSEIPLGNLLLLDVTDLTTLERVEPTYNGQPVAVHRQPGGLSHLTIDDGSGVVVPPPAPRQRGSWRRRASWLSRRLVPRPQAGS